MNRRDFLASNASAMASLYIPLPVLSSFAATAACIHYLLWL